MNRILTAVLTILLMLSSVALAAVNHQYFRADKQYYDPDNDVYIITGNIVIPVSNGSITGDKAKVRLSTLEFWGTSGWTLKQYDVTFKGESAYVRYNQDVAQIEGGADFQRPGLQIKADKVDYNWKSKVATFKGNVKLNKEDKTWSGDALSYNVETKEFPAGVPGL